MASRLVSIRWSLASWATHADTSVTAGRSRRSRSLPPSSLRSSAVSSAALGHGRQQLVDERRPQVALLDAADRPELLRRCGAGAGRCPRMARSDRMNRGRQILAGGPPLTPRGHRSGHVAGLDHAACADPSGAATRRRDRRARRGASAAPRTRPGPLEAPEATSSASWRSWTLEQVLDVGRRVARAGRR